MGLITQMTTRFQWDGYTAALLLMRQNLKLRSYFYFSGIFHAAVFRTLAREAMGKRGLKQSGVPDRG